MPLFTPASLGFITPEMPTLVPEPPSGEGWIHEIKHDGYRTLILIDRRKVRALSRHGRDWTGGPPASSPAKLPFSMERSSALADPVQRSCRL